MADPREEHWTLDKRIPVALLVTLAGNLLAGVVFATLMIAEQRDHSRRIDRLERKDQADDTRAGELSLAVVRLQEATVTLRETVAELKRALPQGGLR